MNNLKNILKTLMILLVFSCTNQSEEELEFYPSFQEKELSFLHLKHGFPIDIWDCQISGMDGNYHQGPPRSDLTSNNFICLEIVGWDCKRIRNRPLPPPARPPDSVLGADSIRRSAPAALTLRLCRERHRSCAYVWLRFPFVDCAWLCVFSIIRSTWADEW